MSIQQILTAYFELRGRRGDLARALEKTGEAIKEIELTLPSQGVARLGGGARGQGVLTATERGAEILLRAQARRAELEKRKIALLLDMQEIDDRVSVVGMGLQELSADRQEIIRRTYEAGQSQEQIAAGMKWVDGDYRDRSAVQYHLKESKRIMERFIAEHGVGTLMME